MNSIHVISFLKNNLHFHVFQIKISFHLQKNFFLNFLLKQLLLKVYPYLILKPSNLAFLFEIITSSDQLILFHITFHIHWIILSSHLVQLQSLAFTNLIFILQIIIILSLIFFFVLILSFVLIQDFRYILIFLIGLNN